MRQHSRAVRGLWLCGVVLQCTLPGASAWADALLDSASAAARPHVESHSTPSCPRSHPWECALCHFLTAPAVASPAVVLGTYRDDERLTPRTDRVEKTDPLARAHPQPRAPPKLS